MSTSISVEELAAQLADFAKQVFTLQGVVKDQAEEISALKRHVVRLEHDLIGSTGGGAFVTLNKTGVTWGEPSASPTYLESNSRVREIQNTASSNPVSPRGAIGVTYPAVGGSSTSSGNLLVHIENGLHSSGSGSYELLSDAEMIQVNDEIHAAAEFRKLLAASESPYLPFTETDRTLLEQKEIFDGVRAEVEALKQALLESREARKVPELNPNSTAAVALFSGSAPSILFTPTNNPYQPSSNLTPTSPSAPHLTSKQSFTTGSKLNTSGSDLVKPHPFNASSSSPTISLANTSLSKQNTSLDMKGSKKATPPATTVHPTSSATLPASVGASDKTVPSKDTLVAASATQGSGSSIGSTAVAGTAGVAESQANADDDISTAGSLSYMNELDYQDLVEATPGRPWPKILNSRKMTTTLANPEQEGPTMKFKEDLQALNVKVIKPDNLIFMSLLGRGSSANVYQGLLYPEGDRSGPSQEVAIKILNTSPTDLRTLMKAHKETLDELFVVQRVQSPHVVRLFGITIEPSICIVLEFCQKGSLYDVLCTDMKLSWGQCIQWFREITVGTLALHACNPAIVHRDLKSLNLLVDEEDKIKVADFGLSRLMAGSVDQLSTLSKMRGTYIYCAPEVYFGEPFTPLSDVYSLGIIFWELIAKLVLGKYQRPFGEYPAVSFGFQVVIMASRKGIRPTIPSCPKVMQKLLVTLWSSNPKSRPSCQDLLKIIDHIEQEYAANKEAWDSGTDFVPQLKDVQPTPSDAAPAASGPLVKASPSPAPSLAATTNIFVPPPSLSAIAASTNNASSANLQPGSTASGSSISIVERSASSHNISKEFSKGGPSASSSGSLKKATKTNKGSLPSLKGIMSKPDKDKSKRRSGGRPKLVFEDLLTEPKVFKVLEARLHKEHSVEYLHFYRAACNFEAKYKEKTLQENILEAKYLETLLPNVSGDDRLIEQIRVKIANSNPDIGMFAEIQGEVTGILRTKFLSLSD